MNKKKGRFVGPVSCVLLLAILAMSVICPQSNGAHALVNETLPADSEQDVLPSFNFGFVVQEEPKEPEDTTIESEMGEFGFEVIQGAVAGSVQRFEKPYGEFGFQWGEFIQIQIVADPEVSDPNKLNDIAMNVNDPTTSGVFTSGTSDFKVITNGASGFSVFVSAENDAKKNLSSAVAGNEAVIAPIAGNTTEENFAANTWGYSVTEKSAAVDTYRPITLLQSGTPAAYTNENPGEGVNLRLTCGTKVSASLPADTYATEIVVSAVAPFSTSWIAQ